MWDYAELVKEAKNSGSPKQYIDDLINEGRELGENEGYRKGAADGILGVLGVFAIITLVPKGVRKVKGVIRAFKNRKEDLRRLDELEIRAAIAADAIDNDEYVEEPVSSSSIDEKCENEITDEEETDEYSGKE